MVFVSLSPARLPATGLPEVLAGAVVPQWPGFAGWLLSPTPVLLAPFQPFWYLINPEWFP